MNLRARKVTIIAVALVTVLALAPAFAQSQESSPLPPNCKEVAGNFIDVTNGGVELGTITNAGDLNGTSTETFTASAPTPVPGVFSFSAEYTLTTNQGQLKANWINLFDDATGTLTVMMFIKPAASTGRFAGATGVLYLNGEVISFAPFTVAAEATGTICYAK